MCYARKFFLSKIQEINSEIDFMAAKNIVFCMEAYYILFDFVILYCIKIFSWLFFVFNLRHVCAKLL